KHIERRVSLSQTLQGKIIFEHGIIQNILNDIYNGTENTYIGVLIKEMDDEKGFLREEMTKLLKDFYVYQKIFSIVDGSNRTSLANEIITIPGIFNSDIKFNNNDPKEIVKMLIDTG